MIGYYLYCAIPCVVACHPYQLYQAIHEAMNKPSY